MEDNEVVNAGKMFVHPPSRVLDRVIYKISDFKLTAVIKNSAKRFMTLDINRMIAMAFFVKKYLALFGNVWKTITQFISMNILFSHYYVTQELVQEVYQIISKM